MPATQSAERTPTAKAAKLLNNIHHTDCVAGMKSLRDSAHTGIVDLAFADPPFNIGYEYDVYQDKKEREAYLDWSRQWIAGVYQALKPTGSFWLAIGDEYAAELKIISQEIGFHPRSWVIWYYTFGVNCKSKFSRSLAHLFYFVKDPEEFTFRGDYLENRIPSARQLVYGDARANPTGRLPDDTWVLRPQDLSDCFTTAEDTWYFPRVAGTFKERAGFHGCQMPEQLLGRIVRLCSNEGDVVLDPFSGSATTVAVAKKLGRSYCAFDLSPDYVSRGLARLDNICVGDPLDGAAEPTVSAPSTSSGVRIVDGQRVAILKSTGARKKSAQAPPPEAATTDDNASVRESTLVQRAILSAFEATYDGYSLDRLVADPDLNARFIAECQARSLPGDARTWNWSLFAMRKAGLMAEYPAAKRTEFSWEACDEYLFASEIAWRTMVDAGHESLDTILCDPALAAEFDHTAARWSPGHTPLEYRWAALKLRKSAKLIRTRAEVLHDAPLGEAVPLKSSATQNIPETSGVYCLFGEGDQPLYAGEASNLRQRIAQQTSPATKPLWQSPTLTASYFSTDCPIATRQAYQHRLVTRCKPRWNLAEAGAV